MPTPKSLGYFMPAEWAVHDAIWLSWPHDRETFGDGLPQVEMTYVEIIAAIHKTEVVNLFVLDNAAQTHIISLLKKKNVDLSRVRFHIHDYADVWFRDYGPSFLLQRDTNKLGMTHWIFNAWGGKYEELKKDTNIPKIIERDLRIDCFRPGIIMEGGSIDVNGCGTVLTTEQCLLNSNRNPSLDRKQIEYSLSEYLGISHVIWLKEGIVGDDTDGHIDDIARFVGPNTVLCATENDSRDSNYHALKENFELLRKSSDQNGKSLEVQRLPMPEAVTDEGGRLPASYANFYIGNEVVLVPVFNCPQDKEALEIISRVFPDRRIAAINCRALVHGLGTLHCISQQQPRPD